MPASEPLRCAGELWAGELPLSDPLVSPLRGEMRGLPPMTVFAGTHEILLADAHRLCRAADRAGVPVRMVESAGQIHAYPLWPTAEARAACRRIYAEVREAVARAEARDARPEAEPEAGRGAGPGLGRDAANGAGGVRDMRRTGG